MNYSWNWNVFWELSLEGQPHYMLLLNGLGWTVTTALCSWCFALILGSAVGVMRTVPNKILQFISICYVEVFRNIPLLVQLFLWYFVLPEILPSAWGEMLKRMDNSAFLMAVCAIGFFMSARVAEQVRTGIQALAGGQAMAATALGLTRIQAYRYVLLPLAYRIILPPLTSDFMNTIKNTSIAMTIGLLELTGRARAMQEFTFQVFEAFTAAAVIYLLLNLLVTFFMQWLERRLAIPGFIMVR